jgi:hypothetical protein
MAPCCCVEHSPASDGSPAASSGSVALRHISNCGWRPQSLRARADLFGPAKAAQIR